MDYLFAILFVGEVLWRSADVDGESLEQHAQDISFSTDSSAIHNLSIQYSLCVTGPALMVRTYH